MRGGVWQLVLVSLQQQRTNRTKIALPRDIDSPVISILSSGGDLTREGQTARQVVQLPYKTYLMLKEESSH